MRKPVRLKNQSLSFLSQHLKATPGALLAIITAAFFLASVSILMRIAENSIGPLATIFNRFWISSIFLLLAHILFSKAEPQKVLNDHSESLVKKQQTYTIDEIFYLLLTGLLFWACLASWAWSLTQTSIANSHLLHNSTPIFTAMAAWLFFHQFLRWQHFIGLSLAMLGVSIFGLSDFNLSPTLLAGDGLALLSAAFAAGNILLVKQLRLKFSVLEILLWSCLVGTVLSYPLAFVFEETLFPSSVSAWLAVLATVIVGQLVGQGLSAYSLKHLAPTIVASFRLLEPLLAAIGAHIFFTEHLSLVHWGSLSLVLIGLYTMQSGRQELPQVIDSPTFCPTTAIQDP